MATATQTNFADPSPVVRPTIGPERHGLAMPYAEFVASDFRDGWRYELARGVVIVTEVPGIHHGRIVLRVARLFFMCDLTYPGVINYQAGGMECRLRIEGMKSDRHPHQAVYLGPHPEGVRLWETWVPELVVEVVSPGGGDRDYVAKREEYLAVGVLEYWVLDPILRRMLVLLNCGGAWREILVSDDATYQCETLPGLEVVVGDLLGPTIPVKGD